MDLDFLDFSLPFHSTLLGNTQSVRTLGGGSFHQHLSFFPITPLLLELTHKTVKLTDTSVDKK